MTRTIVHLTAGMLAALVLAGCLFRTTEPARFYRPGSTALDDLEGAAGEPAPTGAALRLQTVRSAPFLRERVVWRTSTVEYGLYEQRRWFELPSRYVRRALVAAIQNDTRLHLVDDATAPRLEAELLAFDEVLAPQHEATVMLAVKLRDGTRTRFDRTFAAKAPIASDDGAAMAESMGKALDEVVRQVTAAAATELEKKTPGSKRARGDR